jgi:hypothetical protein
MQQPKKIELIKMDITRTTNVITTRSMKFDGYIGVVFDNKKTFEQLVLRDYKDVKVLVKSDDSEPFLDAGVTNILKLRELKKNLNDVSGGKIKNL